MKHLIAAFCLAGAMLAADNITFRGAYIGQPISDYVDCSSGKAKALKEGYKTHGKICDGSGYIFHTQIKGLLYPKASGEALQAENGKIARIRIYVPNDDWEKVRYDLSQKLGEPVSEVPDVYQNGFGARWEFNKGFWVKGDVVASAGVKVSAIGSTAVRDPFTNQPTTEGIEINITDSKHAKLPSTTPSTLD